MTIVQNCEQFECWFEQTAEECECQQLLNSLNRYILDKSSPSAQNADQDIQYAVHP